MLFIQNRWNPCFSMFPVFPCFGRQRFLYQKLTYLKNSWQSKGGPSLTPKNYCVSYGTSEKQGHRQGHFSYHCYLQKEIKSADEIFVVVTLPALCHLLFLLHTTIHSLSCRLFRPINQLETLLGAVFPNRTEHSHSGLLGWDLLKRCSGEFVC